ncbi:MAG: serine hydrolase domain-containing protein [Eubacteriales bacterium]|nr:serine hydrolase domain-containing protein [Eubacteriales bacterium]
MNQKKLTVPEEVGFSSEHLKYIDEVMERAIDEKVMKGMVTLVARHGKIVQYKAYGEARDGEPMTRDHIFRLASMSKPIGAVALLQLFDQGKVMPSDPLSDYIPAFANSKVALADENGEISLVDPIRPVTVHDILTMEAGIVAIRALGEEDQASKYCAKLYEEAGIIDTMHALDTTIEDMVDRLAGLPFASQPGSRWYYSNLSSIVGGRIVEIVTGQNINDYIKEHIFEPLGMTETSFYPEEALWNRIPAVYEVGSMRRLDELDVMGTDDTRLPFGPARSYFSVAAGLSGTVMDYFHFAQMLCDHGSYHGNRILSPNAVKLLSTNHIREQRTNLYGHAWGYMVNVQEDYNTMFNYMGLGSYGWHGYWGSVFNVWPEKDVVAIFISQVSPVLPSWKIQERFLNVVANAIIDP